MDKKALIDHLSEIYRVLRKLDNIEHEINNLKRAIQSADSVDEKYKPKHLEISKIFGAFFDGLLPSVPLYLIITLFTFLKRDTSVIYDLRLSIALAVCLIFFLKSLKREMEENKKKNEDYLRGVNVRNKHRNELRAKRVEMENSIVKYRNDYANTSAMLDRLMSNGILPRKYCDSLTLESILEYLKECRADTLKEAINLYEANRERFEREFSEMVHRRKVQQAMEAQASRTEQLLREAERTAATVDDIRDKADEAAYWGKVSAYLIDKNTRK